MALRASQPILLQRTAVASATLAAAFLLGCGLAAAPQPPSLHLPKPVQDLQAERIGGGVHLTWTAPKTTTDGLKLTTPVPTRICIESEAASRGSGGVTAPSSKTADYTTLASVTTSPGKPAESTVTLPTAMTQGPPRAITLRVEALGPKQKSAGRSNPAQAWAGATPPPITGLTAQSAPQGVLLRWQPTALPTGTMIELQRTLLAAAPAISGVQKTKSAAPHSTTKSSAKAGPPPVQILRVQPIADATRPNQLRDPGAAYDASIEWGATYRYTAARVLQAAPGSSLPLRIASSPGAAVDIQARDTFPPTTPRGLAAVLVAAAMNGGHAAVALSWTASREPEFADYIVYRRDLASNAPAAPIAPAPGAPASARIVTPIYQDASVAPGHSYAYSVSSVDLFGNASPRSAEVTVTLPAQ